MSMMNVLRGLPKLWAGSSRLRLQSSWYGPNLPTNKVSPVLVVYNTYSYHTTLPVRTLLYAS